MGIPATRRDFFARALGAAAVLSGFGAVTSAGGGATAPVPVSVEPAAGASTAPLSDPAWVARHRLPAAQYQAEFDRLVREGYRLVDICGYEDASREMYATLWEKSGGPPWVARHGLTAAAYQAEFDRLNREGYRPVRISGFGLGRQARFAAIWHQVAGPAAVVRHGLSGAEYQAEFNRLTSGGYRPVEVCGYDEGGQARFAGIWERSAGPAWVARHNVTAAEYQAEFTRLAAQGYRLTRVSAYAIGTDVRYAAIWYSSGGSPWAARHGLRPEGYQAEFDQLAARGYRPVQVSAAGGAIAPVFAAIWEKRQFSQQELKNMSDVADAFMKRWNVPGMSVAIAYQGRLAYAQGFGLADKSSGEKVAADSRFRIASVSKPITSVTVMKLIEGGSLRLTDTVFGSDGILGTAYGKQPYGTNIEKITVQHLLEHTTGWRNNPRDPMFDPDLRTYDHGKLISWMLDNRPLADSPGNSWDYSNFGYCVLGRVIEKVTGKPYHTSVRERVLEPCGITGMTLAGNTLADRQPREVVYYGQNGDGDPYSMQVTRMDSHGGWVATATDLVRLAVRVDGFPTKPDILSPASITTMTTASTARPVPSSGSGYAKGWVIHSDKNWFHDGALPGTSSILVRRADGFCWAALLNTRDPDNKIIEALDQMMRDLHDKVDGWPAYDLF
ncbi:MAG TPA: serine hydrolase [Pseudonocardiaceae bacterium]|nr:serine hydrolase [Pseudonocardiaceae bacterium]